MPPGWVFAVYRVDPDRARRGYRRGLHILGVDRVKALIEAAAADDPRPPSLCCFEPDPFDCHRGPEGFAGWWEAQNPGEFVPDLGLLVGVHGGAVLCWECE
jgi:hypothetical protein